jgi:hypothetical protein
MLAAAARDRLLSRRFGSINLRTIPMTTPEPSCLKLAAARPVSLQVCKIIATLGVRGTIIEINLEFVGQQDANQHAACQNYERIKLLECAFEATAIRPL